MPQMSPMDWFFLFIYFMMIYYLILLIIYFIMDMEFNKKGFNLNNNFIYKYDW